MSRRGIQGTVLLTAMILALPALACGAGSEAVGSTEISAEGGNPMNEANQSIATFAGGCFWCMEGPFEALDGVYSVVSGYTDGQVHNPTYQQVSSGSTGHTEAVQITYDANRVSYEELLEIFWRQIDPTDAGGQFADRGSQYRTGIYYHDANQQQLAERSKAELDASGRFDKPIVTEIKPASTFYPAGLTRI